MFGFIAIIAFVIAWNAGGWWWLLAIFIGLGWIGSKGEKGAKKQEKSAAPLKPLMSGDGKKKTEIPDGVNDRIAMLTEVCARFSGTDFYVAELIPEKRLENALKHYPLENGNGSKVIALIDTTVMGSADNGMLIHNQGLSWKNWILPSKITSLKWKEFEELAISVKGTKIHFGNDAVFETAASQFGAEKTFGLLSDIGKLVEYWPSQSSQSKTQKETAPENETWQDRVKRLTSPSEKVLIDINRASFEDLLSLPGIGAAEAKLIQDRRESLPFQSLDSLVDFLGLKPHKADQLKDRVIFSEPDIKPVRQDPTSPQVNTQGRPNDLAPPASPAPLQPAPGRRVID